MKKKFFFKLHSVPINFHSTLLYFPDDAAVFQTFLSIAVVLLATNYYGNTPKRLGRQHTHMEDPVE